jgi:hypothetical protein
MNPHSVPLFLEKIIRFNSGLFQDRSQSPFRHVARMVGDGCEPASDRIAPDFVTPRRMTIKLKAKGLEFFDDLPISEPR